MLLLSLWLFVQDRPFLAVTAACMAAIVHSTYLLGAGMLTYCYLRVLFCRDLGRQAFLVGCLALLLVAPVLYYVARTFSPTSPDLFARAQEILVQVRIPHHCLPRLWLDPIAAFQIAWFLGALFLVRSTVLFAVFCRIFVFTAALTLAQVVTDSNTIALMFPWRTSAFLIPVATAVIVGRLVLAGARWLERWPVEWLGGAVAAALAAAGIAIMCFRQGFNSSPEEVDCCVSSVKSPTDVYLSVAFWPGCLNACSLSSDFKSAVQRRRMPGYSCGSPPGSPRAPHFHRLQSDSLSRYGSARMIDPRISYLKMPAAAGSKKRRFGARTITHLITTADRRCSLHVTYETGTKLHRLE